MQTVLSPSNYYRLPWTLNDNVLAWLEPTKRCNLYCEGCYSGNRKDSDKSIEQVRSDLDVIVRNRRVDSISVAGGDPLVHPDIVEITRIIKEEYRLKPVLNTNGHALTPQLLRELKRAGVFGFTFHVDSGQSRPQWKGKNELELNELRLYYARMVSDVGGISTAFNSTVYPHTLEYVPGMVQWAREHIDIVHGMVFILFRTTETSKFDYFAKGEKIDIESLVYYDESKNPQPLRAPQIVNKIRESEPDFEPCAYLGGTKDPKSFKWLLTIRIGDEKQIYGYAGKRFIELAQSVNHFINGRYLAYSHPDSLKHGRSLLLAASAVDSGFREGAKRFARALFRSPSRIRSRLHMQSILIIQPIDMQVDGETNMCDGCPDMTVNDGKLVWSCRLEEQINFGCFLTAAPKNAHAEKVETRDERERQEGERPEIRA